MRQKALENSIKECFSDWDGDFDVDVESEERHRGYEYFSCVVTHDTIGEAASFTARVDAEGDCDMDFYEDCWQPISKGSLFAFMWFEAKTT